MARLYRTVGRKSSRYDGIMPLPSDVITKQLTIYPGTSPFGDPMSIEISMTLEPSIIVWEATGEPIISFFQTARSTVGQPLTVTLPAVDQPGFADEQGETITNWRYNVLVKYLLGPQQRKVGVHRLRVFQPKVDDQPASWFLEDPDE